MNCIRGLTHMRLAAVLLTLTALDSFAAPPELPLSFEAHDGRYVARAAGYTAVFGNHEIALGIGEDLVRLKFRGGNPRTRPTLVEPRSSYTNYYIGSRPESWRKSVVGYGGVRYENIYPGVDAVFYGNGQRLEYDLVLRPGARLSRIVMEFGGSGLRIAPDGDLIVRTRSGEIRQGKPVLYQVNGASRTPVEGHYRLQGKNQAALEAGPYDRSRPLVIDPIIFSTYFGGTGDDYPGGLGRDSAGNVYISGRTNSANFPVAGGIQMQKGAGMDAFVAKFNSTGGLLWCTYLGGSLDDLGGSLAVDNAGNVYVAGRTYSADFPVLSALQTQRNGGNDAFVAKLDPNGALVYSTYLGGSALDYALGIAVDSGGNAVVAGFTTSVDFPTVNAFQPRRVWLADAFVAKLNAAGTALVYSSYLAGSSYDYANDVILGPDGDAYIIGDTTSIDMPVYHAFQPSYAGGTDGFLARVAPDGTLKYWTYFGGNGADALRHAAVNAAGEVWFTGETTSTNLPMVTPLRPVNAGGSDALLARLDGTGSTLLYSTYLGGSGNDYGYDLALDTSGNVYLGGNTASSDFPLVSPVQGVYGGGQDGFAMKLNPSGSSILFSSYLGGSAPDTAYRIALADHGDMYLAGNTQSTNFPTAQPFQSARRGGNDGYLAKIGTCAFTISPSSQVFDPAGGTGTVLVTTTSECSWSAAADDPWITLTSGAAGTGNGSVSFTVAANGAASPHSGTITIAGQTFTANQAGTAITLSSILPAAGVPGTSVPVTLGGANFAAGMTVTSGNPGIVASNVHVVSPGQITATLQIAPSAAQGPATVTVSGAGAVSNPVTFTVQPAAPAISSITPASGSNGSIVPVTLNGTNFVSGASVAINNPNIVVSQVVVASPTQMSATLAISAATMPGAFNITVTTAGGNSNSVPFTVNGPSVASISVSPASVAGGTSATANKVTLTSPALPGGTLVTLSSSDPSATPPPSVMVLQGATISAAFTIATAAVSANTPVTITAAANGATVNGTLTVTPPLLTNLTIAASSIASGKTVNATITLNGTAPAGGIAVTMSSSDPAAAPLPPTVTVPAGAKTAVVAVNAGYVGTSTVATLSASFNGVTKSVNLTVTALTVTNLRLAASSVVSGKTVNATVTLSGPAPSGGTAVILTSSDPSLTVPGTVTVPAGATTATAATTAGFVTASTVTTVSAAFGGVAKTANLTITPTQILNFTLASGSVVSGKPVNATVTLNGPAPPGGAPVSVSSSGPEATPPATATVAAGATALTFPVSTGFVTTATPVTISAVYGGMTKSANLTVAATTVSNLTVASGSIVSGKTVTATITLNGPAPPAGVLIAIGSSDPAASAPATAMVAGGATKGAFLVNAGFTTVSTVAVLSASLNGSSRSVNLTVAPTAVLSLTLAATRVTGGKTVNATVTLNGPASPAGAQVVFTSSDPAATVQPAVTIAAGGTTATVPVSTTAVSAATVITIGGSYGPVTKTVVLTLTP